MSIDKHMPQLQIALDAIGLEEAYALMETIAPMADIVEAGTPFVLEYGLGAVRELKQRFPSLSVLCDGKIMDAGCYEAEAMFRAGADWVTVMALTDSFTISECIAAARRAGGRVMVDMLCVQDVPERVALLEKLGVDCIAVHTGVDQQRLGRTALDDLRLLKRCVTHTPVAVAGGITLETLDAYLALEPDILIVGGGVLAQPDPAAAARSIRNRIVSFQPEG